MCPSVSHRMFHIEIFQIFAIYCLQSFRLEEDSLGEIHVPAGRLWGAQTQRSIEYFKIGDAERMPKGLIRSMGIVKLAAARVNKINGKISNELSNAILAAAEEVIDGVHDDEFPLVVWYVFHLIKPCSLCILRYECV